MHTIIINSDKAKVILENCFIYQDTQAERGPNIKRNTNLQLIINAIGTNIKPIPFQHQNTVRSISSVRFIASTRLIFVRLGTVMLSPLNESETAMSPTKKPTTVSSKRKRFAIAFFSINQTTK